MDDQFGIGAARAAFAEALGRGDAEAAAALYASDARLVPPASELVEGREAIEAFWRAGIEIGVSEAEFESIDLRRHDGLAYEIGRYSLEVHAGEGEFVVDRGTYLLVHERQPDGTWFRAAEIFNADGLPSTRPRGRNT